MNVLHIAVPAMLLLAGCSGPEKAPPAAASAAEAGVAEVVPAPKTFTKEKPAGPAQETSTAPAVPVPASPVAKPETPALARTPAVAVGPPKKEIPAAPIAKPATSAPKLPAPVVVRATSPAAKPPALDLETLEKRLKETSAIGVMTKLTIKNQVDDLLERFRAHYDGRGGTTLAQLRQPFDTLIFKVLAALQDGDPSLAKAVADSREAIWAILSNPEKFRNL